MEGADLERLLATRWRTTVIEPLFPTVEPPPDALAVLPADYLGVIRSFGGREGFLGEVYLRLYRLEELAGLNVAYDVETFFPEVLIFGSDGCGEAFAFPLGKPSVLKVPFIPLMAEFAETCASSFTEFIQQSSASGESGEANPSALGMEVHEIHPIVLGGDPVDEGNKVLVPVGQHAELCRFWNKTYRDLRSRQEGK